MSESKIIMLTGNLSGAVSGGMGVATSEIANHLAAISTLHLVKSGSESFPSIQHVHTIHALTPARQIVSYSVFPGEVMESKQYDFLISPYRTDKAYVSTIKASKGESTLEVIETVGPTYLEEVAFYNQKLIELAQTLTFDTIYCHDWTTFQAGISLKLQTGKKLVLHIHSLETDRKPDNKNPNVYYLERKAMDYADVVIAVSNYTKALIQKNYEIYPGKIQVVYNACAPLNLPPIKNETSTLNVLFMGRLTRQKGIDNFISIAEIVYAKFPNVQFIIAGEGELRTEIEDRVENSSAADAIHLMGYLNHDEKLNLLAITDIFCLPSESEPFGMSALEAASAGIPCIVSKQSGISEVLNSSLKADFNDIQGFALGILSLLESESLRNTLSEEQLKEISPLSWDQAAQQIKELL